MTYSPLIHIFILYTPRKNKTTSGVSDSYSSALFLVRVFVLPRLSSRNITFSHLIMFFKRIMLHSIFKRIFFLDKANPFVFIYF
uniref:Uncharacterized protein n=1 Tax=Lepeophtheirus salmonis TaxID=72036 RepID=A0A0K2UNH4_LEPSM